MNITRRSFHYATLASLAAITAPQLGRSAAAQTPKAGGTLRYGTVTEVTSLDPHVYNGSAWKVLIEALYSPLVGYATDGTIAPRLAERWEQPDARTIIFHLRQGVKFHDGTPLTADDVKFSLERIIAPKTAAALRTNLIGATVEVIDAKTVKVSQPQPDATLLAILALPEGAIVSRKWIEGGANAKTAANGTGPFRLDVYEPSVRAVLKKNPAYFVPGQPRLDTVEVRMIKSDDARVNALRSGALDMIDFVPWKDIRRVEPYAQLQGRFERRGLHECVVQHRAQTVRRSALTPGVRLRGGSCRNRQGGPSSATARRSSGRRRRPIRRSMFPSSPSTSSTTRPGHGASSPKPASPRASISN